jgi:hypothetical protein
LIQIILDNRKVYIEHKARIITIAIKLSMRVRFRNTNAIINEVTAIATVKA